MNETDKAIHELYRAFESRDIAWNDFPGIGLSESYYLWYYAEKALYIIRDCMTDQFYLVKARNPVEAFGKLTARLDEAMRAGDPSYVEEEESNG